MAVQVGDHYRFFADEDIRVPMFASRVARATAWPPPMRVVVIAHKQDEEVPISLVEPVLWEDFKADMLRRDVDGLFRSTYTAWGFKLLRHSTIPDVHIREMTHVARGAAYVLDGEMSWDIAE